MKKILIKVGFLFMVVSLLAGCKNVTVHGPNLSVRLAVTIFDKNYEGIKETVALGANINKVKASPLFYTGSCKYAFYKADDHVVSFLIENGANVKQKSLDGRSLLMDFAYNNSFDLCKLALEHGAHVNDKDIYGNTALEYLFLGGTARGTELGIERTLNLFIENGAKVRAKTLEAAFEASSDHGDGDCKYRLVKEVLEKLIDEDIEYEIDPVLEAAMLDKKDDLIQLIQNGNMKPEYENQILFYTASFGSVEAMKFLKEKGLDLFAVNRLNDTTLMVASRYGNLEMVKYLIEQKLDIQAKNFDGETAMLQAATYNQVDVIKELIKNKAATNYDVDGFKKSALLWAARNGSLDVVQFFIENPELTDEDSLSTALNSAATAEQIHVVKYLIRKGCDVNSGDGPLEYACLKGNLEIAKLLVENGAKIDGIKNDGEPLEISCRRPNLELVQYLVENGADVNAVQITSDGLKTESALMTAIQNGCFDTVQYLVENGADINYIEEDNGYSVLDYAVDEYSTNIIKYLIENGADINYKNYEGETPLMLALQYAGYDNIKILLENNADLTLKNNEGKTALEIAKDLKIEKDFKDLIELVKKEK